MLLHHGEVAFQGTAGSAVSAYSQRLHGNHKELHLRSQQALNSSLVPTACYMAESTGEALHSAYYTTPMSIVVEYEVREPLRGVQIAVEIWSQEFGCILCLTNLDVPNNRATVQGEGKYRTTCVLPQLLRPGEYWIDISASIPGIQVLFETTTAWDFEVIDDGSPLAILSQGRRGAVLPVVGWKEQQL